MVQVLYKGRKRLVHIGKNGGKYVIVEGTKRYLRPKTKPVKKKTTKTKTTKGKKLTKTKMKGGDGTCRMCRGIRLSSKTRKVNKKFIDSYLKSLVDQQDPLYKFKEQGAYKKSFWNKNSELKICRTCYHKLLAKFRCHACSGQGIIQRDYDIIEYFNSTGAQVSGYGNGVEERKITDTRYNICRTCQGNKLFIKRNNRKNTNNKKTN